MGQCIVRDQDCIEAVFWNAAEISHVRHMESDIQISRPGFADRSRDGRFAQIRTDQSMTSLRQADDLGSDPAGTIQNIGRDLPGVLFQNWTKNRSLPGYATVPILKHQVIRLSQVV